MAESRVVGDTQLLALVDKAVLDLGAGVRLSGVRVEVVVGVGRLDGIHESGIGMDGGENIESMVWAATKSVSHDVGLAGLVLDGVIKTLHELHPARLPPGERRLGLEELEGSVVGDGQGCGPF